MNYKTGGIKLFEISTDEGNLWYDHDSKRYNSSGAGFFISVRWGWMLRPIPKFWKKGFWTGEKQYNPWDNEFWFVLRFPIIAPFVSLAILSYGLYAGVKPYRLNRERYKNWLPNWWAYSDTGRALALSASIRRTRWK